jgi:GNAT superfamily N-acetyltransferase
VSPPVITTYLELTDPAELRPARAPEVPGMAVTLVDPPDGSLNHWLYTHVGRDYSWTDHLDKDGAWWQRHAANAETWVLSVDGQAAGYAELERDGDGGVEIAYLGLLGAFQGRGLGGHLLTHALRRALELGGRAWVHTCTLDGPHALANYRRRGMRAYRREVTPGRADDDIDLLRSR